jgi:hypothetical protein
MRQTTLWVVFVLLGMSCTTITGLDNEYVLESAATAGGGQGGGGGAGGHGGDPQSCTNTADCDDKNPCTIDECELRAGVCERSNVADGPTPGVSDAAADCIDRVCVAGVDTEVPDDVEVPDDSNACTTDACSGGMPVHTNVMADTPCGGVLVCDGIGNCVGCTSPLQCPPTGNPCADSTCNAQTCGTTDVPVGTPCAGGICNGQGACVDCVSDADCTGSVCAGGVCVECVDDNDCGGGDATCRNNVCVNECSDGTMNGSETDVDCGGSCPDCGDGQMCNSNLDCQNDCNKGICGP